MRRPETDWSYLLDGWRWQLAASAILLVTMGATIPARNYFDAEAARQAGELAVLDQQRQDLATRIAARRQAEARYLALREAGVMGAEQRLGWVQAMRDSADALGLPYLRFSAQPQRPFEATYLMAGEGPAVLASTVNIEAGLVHEGDLLRLIERLRAEAPGFFGVSACKLERLGGEEPPAADRANIAGLCELRWFSIPPAPAAVAEVTE